MEFNDLNCKICNKKYKSYQSLWNHNNKFHNVNNNKLQPNISLNTAIDKSSDQSIKKHEYKCQYCNKNYKHFQSRWKHEQKCKIIDNKNMIDKDIELEKIKLQLAKEESTILRLKLKLEKSNKIDNITLKKLNKMLMERNNKIKHINLYEERKKQDATFKLDMSSESLNDIMTTYIYEDNSKNSTNLIWE